MWTDWGVRIFSSLTKGQEIPKDFSSGNAGIDRRVERTKKGGGKGGEKWGWISTMEDSPSQLTKLQSRKFGQGSQSSPAPQLYVLYRVMVDGNVRCLRRHRKAKRLLCRYVDWHPSRKSCPPRIYGNLPTLIFKSLTNHQFFFDCWPHTTKPRSHFH